MTKHIFVLLALLLMSISASAQKGKSGSKEMNAGILFGPSFSYTLSAPNGWLMDNESGANQGLSAVFYPKGSSWNKGIAVMYANVMVKKDDKQTVSDLIKEDIDGAKADSPTVKIEDGKAIELDKNKTAIVKYFSNDAHGNYEALAYVNEAKVVVLIALTAKTKKDFDSSLPAFEELVKTYFFLTDNVTIKK